MTTENATAFEGWAILELMGHRKLGCYVQEATLAGAGFLRVQVPKAKGGWAVEQLYPPSSVYCLTPVSEAVACGYALRCQPEPVTRWELPAPEPVVIRGGVDLASGHDVGRVVPYPDCDSSGNGIPDDE